MWITLNGKKKSELIRRTDPLRKMGSEKRASGKTRTPSIKSLPAKIDGSWSKERQAPRDRDEEISSFGREVRLKPR